jgi:putative phosphoesterase
VRVLLCSDIHGNAAALEAVLDDPVDHVLCAGDLVHFGPEPEMCIDLIRRRATAAVQGNHDHGAGYGDDCRAYGPWRELDEIHRTISDAALSPEDGRYLRTLPLGTSVTLGGARFVLVHAAPSDPLYRYLRPDTPEDVWEAELSGLDVDVLVLGHTHLPLLHPHGRTVIVNPGSVGLPRHGDVRASYAIWDDGQITLQRRAYDQTPLKEALARLPRAGSRGRETGRLVRGPLAGGRMRSTDA